MIRIAHISEKMKYLSEDFDNLYELLSDEDLLKLIDTNNNKLSKEDYE